LSVDRGYNGVVAKCLTHSKEKLGFVKAVSQQPLSKKKGT